MLGAQRQSGARPVRLAYCYAPGDDSQVRDLDRHLQLPRSNGLIEILDPGALLPGVDGVAETARQIDQAEIILFFVSSESLAVTLARQGQRVLARHARGEVRLLPVLVRPSLWKESPLAPLVPLPRNECPVSKWNSPDEAWVDVVQDICSIARDLTAPLRSHAPSSERDPRVVIFYADADAGQAERISHHLTLPGLHTTGQRFASMDRALADSEYCLVLWSQNAAAQAGVSLEWEGALLKSVQQKRGFLVTARLEDLGVPKLLASRLCVDLFPKIEPGIEQLLALWRQDRQAEQKTARPVASAPCSEPLASALPELFVTSAAFGITVPVRVALEHVAGVLLSRVVRDLKLPSSLEHEGRIGVRFDYALALGDKTLAADVPLRAQGVQEHSVLWIETTMAPFAAAQPVRGRLHSAQLRSEPSGSLEAAQKHLHELISRNGLGRDYPSR